MILFTVPHLIQCYFAFLRDARSVEIWLWSDPVCDHSELLHGLLFMCLELEKNLKIVIWSPHIYQGYDFLNRSSLFDNFVKHLGINTHSYLLVWRLLIGNKVFKRLASAVHIPEISTSVVFVVCQLQTVAFPWFYFCLTITAHEILKRSLGYPCSCLLRFHVLSAFWPTPMNKEWPA